MAYPAAKIRPLPSQATWARNLSPRGVGRNPAASRARASGESCTAEPSARSIVSRPSAPPRAAAARAARSPQDAREAALAMADALIADLI